MVMRLGDIDYKRIPLTAQLFLCKPNKEVISKINEAYQVTYNPKLGALNELSFSIPVFIEKRHVMEKNQNVDLIKGRFLVKLVLGKHEEFFIITQTEKKGEESGEEYAVTALSLGFELNDKLIREYKAVSLTATELLEDALADTIWNVGYVDSEFDLKYRGLEISSSTVLEVVFEIAKTFNALVVWDSLNRRVGLYKPDSVGLDRGLKIKYGKYLETLNLEDNSEEVITRLRMYGKENLSIREINPTGTTYIEDLRFFTYPYEEKLEEDGSYIVIKHSDYMMSDDLCHAILMYDKLLEDNRGAFETLVAKRKMMYGILDVKTGERNSLNTKHKILLDQRDVLNTRIAKMEDEVDQADNLGNDTILLKSNLESLKNELAAKLIEIDAKKLELNQKEAEVAVANADVQAVLEEITELKELLALENNFTPELLVERNQFIIEKEWQDNNIDNAEDLLKEGLKIFEEVRQQKITLKVDVVNFLSMITEQINWDKLNLGDIVYIEHERLGVSFKAKITEIEYSFDDNSINITISNVKDLYANKDKFLDMLYKGYGSSTQINIDKWKWDLSMENKGSINEIINNVWDANKQAIIGAKDQVVELSDRGLIIRDPNDPSTYLVGLNGMIAITNDGGKTWKHAITGSGIVGERVYGKVIMGVNLAIEDEHGIVKWQGSMGEIFDRNGKLVMKMGLVDEEPDTFGLWSFNDITRVKMDDRTGFAVERKNSDTRTYPDGWEKVMWTDVDGTLYTHDLVAENIKIVNDIGKTILDAENNYLDIGDFENIVMDNKFTTIEKMQIITELYKIEAAYKRMLEQASKYIKSERDDDFDTSSQFFSKSPSTTDLYSTTAITNAYNDLLTYISQYIKVDVRNPLTIDVNDPLTETTSEISDRAEFILMFKNYYDAEKDLRNKIEDAQFYSSLNMGQYYNNVVIGEYGFIALRDDGKYRAWLNATNGLALQKWENNQWVNKVYASIGSSTYEDGTLIAEDLVARRLRIETKAGGVLLDVDSLQLDFSVLDYIILDDVIMSPEKITLSNQFKSLTQQYNELKETINRYTTTIYNDRDSSYSDLNAANIQLINSGTELTAAYNALKDYLVPIFADMNKKTHIVDDLNSTRVIFYSKWEDFYKSFENSRNKLADFLEKSSLQLGRNYNNTVIDAENGIVVTRGNMMNRTTLNATEGIMIEKNVGSPEVPNWVKKFYVDLNGILTAEDLVAKRLKIETKNGDTLLDVDSLQLDFSTLNYIILDDVIMSPEKVTLLNQYRSITKQYTELKETINKYATTIYSDRDSTYSGIDEAKNSLLSAVANLDNAYNSLKTYMTPVFVDMNKKTHIVSDLNSTRNEFYSKWEAFYNAYETGRSSLSNFLEKSSLQLGRNYNNTVIDAVKGVVVTRGNLMNRTTLNATEGIMIEKNIGTSNAPIWEKKFYVDMNGTLMSEDLVATRLTIRTKDGNTLLDADSLNIDFTVLNSIILDDVIMSTEKITLLNQFKSITQQYNSLRYQMEKYETSIYTDRESTYGELDDALNHIIVMGVTLDTAYNDLNSYMTPVFADMNATTHIVNDLNSTRTIFHQKWESFYNAYENARNMIEDFLEKSSLQLGRNYNNTVIDAENGIVVTRSNLMNRTILNATEGISIEKNVGTADSPVWVKKLYADMDGTLMAEDLVAVRLTIKTNAGGVLLDADSLNIDFTVLNSIILDNVIMSPEKITLLNQFKSITQQYNLLRTQMTKYEGAVYDNREQSYAALDTVLNQLIAAGVTLDLTYNDLSSYMAPVFVNMNAKTHISNDLHSTRAIFHQRWESFYNAYDSARNILEDFLEKSSLQLGRNYNNVVIDAENGIVITGANQEEVRMNASEGFAIDVAGEQRFWVSTDGTLRAKKLLITDGDVEPVELEDGSYISQLTVSAVRTMDNTNSQDYVFIKDQYIKLISGNGITDSEKLKIWLDSPSGDFNGIPKIKMGEGNGANDNEIGFIVKDADGFKFDYLDTGGNVRRLWMNRAGAEGILMESVGNVLRLRSTTSIRLEIDANNFIEITPQGVRINGNRIDLN